MRLEIVSAADFLVQLLRLQTGQLSESQLQSFKSSLTDLLRHRYRDHWFPDKPNRGSGYRCIRINGKMDPVIAQAGIKVGLVPNRLRNLFPSELTMWIDPAEVSYRIGENGSICVLFEGTGPEPPQPAQQQQHQHQQQHHHRHHHQQQQHASSNNSMGGSPQQQQHHHHLQQQHHHHQQQQFEQTCKDSLLMEHMTFGEQIAAFVSG